MKIRTLVLIAALALTLASGVAAADEGEHFDGSYIGGNLGNAVHTFKIFDRDYDWFGGTQDLRGDGLVFGLQGGHNWQSGAGVFGIELDYNFSSISEDYRYSDAVDIETELDALATLRFRGGLAVGRTLVFTTAGLAYGDFSASWNEDGDPDDSFPDLGDSVTGWVYGAGIEHVTSNGNISWKVEGLWTVFDDYDVTNDIDYTFVIDNEVFVIRFGVNYHF
jgi:outer membrane immunogenic protein